MHHSLIILFTSLLTSISIYAENYPSKPVTIVVPFSAGGATDKVARSLAIGLSKKWKQSVIVENVAGASGSLGTARVAKAAPDGYQLLLASTSSHTVFPSTGVRLPWDPVKSFVAIAAVAHPINVIQINASLAAKDLKEFINLSRENPKKYSYGSSGLGTTLQIGGKQFEKEFNIELLHVPYKGAAPALSDLVGGQINVMFGPLADSIGFIKNGKIRALAVISSKKRARMAPDIPTGTELGYTPLLPSWLGLFGPAGLSDEIAQQIFDDIQTVIKNPETAKLYDVMAMDLPGMNRQEFSQTIQSELSEFSKLDLSN
ncbi:Argininosuccinate lyase [Delftia tsuruhatensis]|uniref:Bug family tripartite tricarboxylate transporter substrate binding protein n=1 Tax=Delftia tsuruhatensis TaxID=180282 RepID=UPI001E797082|nr:tripartite tricarboxylate transporter substrate binding protein [Delftia tsuruhatensis]CAB5684579.1 Argininosuccinate lyase [Delftia tsuruhatensis]CAC9676060.1 Argininosuccinate lyase [Delftia tsuruhatensis]